MAEIVEDLEAETDQEDQVKEEADPEVLDLEETNLEIIVEEVIDLAVDKAEEEVEALVEIVEETDQAEVDSAVEIVEEAEEASTTAQEKCIKQYVLNVRKNVKFLSSQPKESQYIAVTVLQNTRVTNLFI